MATGVEARPCRVTELRKLNSTAEWVSSLDNKLLLLVLGHRYLLESNREVNWNSIGPRDDALETAVVKQLTLRPTTYALQPRLLSAGFIISVTCQYASYTRTRTTRYMCALWVRRGRCPNLTSPRLSAPGRPHATRHTSATSPRSIAARLSLGSNKLCTLNSALAAATRAPISCQRVRTAPLAPSSARARVAACVTACPHTRRRLYCACYCAAATPRHTRCHAGSASPRPRGKAATWSCAAASERVRTSAAAAGAPVPTCCGAAAQAHRARNVAHRRAARNTRCRVRSAESDEHTRHGVTTRSQVAGVVLCGDRGARAEWRLCARGAVRRILLACGLARWRCGTGNGGDGNGSDSGGCAVRGSGLAHHSVRSGGVATARPHGARTGPTASIAA